jgi:hypothetical protein
MLDDRYLSSLQVLSGTEASASSVGSALGASLFRNVVDLSHLKNKELDGLESALDFFTTPHTRPTLQQPTPMPVVGSTATIEEVDESKESEEPPPAPAAAPAAPVVVPTVPRVLPQKDGNAFDIETLRDHRLRGYYGDRYDARANLIDWDYHMRLKAVVSSKAKAWPEGSIFAVLACLIFDCTFDVV